MRNAVLCTVVAVAGCGTPAPTPAPTPTPPAEAAPPIVLRRTPANLGCDLINPPYRSFMIHIDPLADEQVLAISERGHRLLTHWPPGFAAEMLPEPAVRDASGAMVARQDEFVDIPDGERPRLHGYWVCPSARGIAVVVGDLQ
jgi:hypothetical protein